MILDGETIKVLISGAVYHVTPGGGGMQIRYPPRIQKAGCNIYKSNKQGLTTLLDLKETGKYLLQAGKDYFPKNY